MLCAQNLFLTYYSSENGKNAKKKHWRTWQQRANVSRCWFWQISLANMRAIAHDYEKCGEDLWQRFKCGKDEQSWYYHAAVKAMDALEFASPASLRDFLLPILMNGQVTF